MHVVHDVDQPDRDPAQGLVAPHDLDAEAMVLSAVLIDPSALGAVSEFLRPEHFFAERHRRIFEACLGLAGGPIDIGLVGAWLKDRGRIEQVGGLAYLTEIINASPAIAHVENHAAVIYEKWRARQLMDLARRIVAEGTTDYGDTQKWIEQSALAVAKLARATLTKPAESFQDAIARMVREWMNRPANEGPRTRGISSGLAGYDELTAGLHAGQKTTIVALPGHGKTTLGLQIAEHVARQGIGAIVFSQEMKRDELILKLISKASRIDSKRFRDFMLTPDEWTRLLDAANQLQALPLVVDDEPDLHIGQIRERTRKYIARAKDQGLAPIGLVVLDYIQRLTPAPEVQRARKHEQVAHATTAFKVMCQQFRIAGIELAQQRSAREDERKGVATPAPKYVADSSQVEKEADNLFFIVREAAYGPGGRVVGPDRRKLRLVLTKQRGGPEGEVPLTFEPEFSQFIDRVDEP